MSDFRLQGTGTARVCTLFGGGSALAAVLLGFLPALVFAAGPQEGIAEVRSSSAPQALAAAADGRTASFAGEVRAYFLEALNREPTGGEKQLWVTVAASQGKCAAPGEEITAGGLGYVAMALMAGTPEFFLERETNIQRVNALYRAALARSPTSGERTWWLEVLNGGESWITVVRTVLDGETAGSGEYRARVDQICQAPRWPVRGQDRFIPPSPWWVSPAWQHCWGPDALILECRDLRGVEGNTVPGSEPNIQWQVADWYVIASKFHPAFGWRLFTSGNQMLEGCHPVDEGEWWDWRCDYLGIPYNIPSHNYELVARMGAGNWFPQVLAGWGSASSADKQDCAQAITGQWDGSDSPNDVKSACRTAFYASAPSYVALGDSYSAGDGAEDYADGCNRSANAAPLALRRHWPKLRLVFKACSGNKTKDVAYLGGPRADSYQVDALRSSTQAVTISIGGNDAGFSDVLKTCLVSDCLYEAGQAEKFVRERLPARLLKVFKAIRQRAPLARVFVLGYPRLFGLQTCNGALGITIGDQRALNKASNALADVTAVVAGSMAGFTFVDTRAHFRGHHICSGANEWIRGISGATFESFHPNKTGQAAFSHLLLAHGFSGWE